MLAATKASDSVLFFEISMCKKSFKIFSAVIFMANMTIFSLVSLSSVALVLLLVLVLVLVLASILLPLTPVLPLSSACE